MSSITDKYGSIRKPLIYFKGRLLILEATEYAESHSFFGGDLPFISDVPISAKIHSLFTLKRDTLDVFDGIPFACLNLVYPFMHDGGSIKYQIRHDGEIVIDAVIPEVAVDDWPYEGYPSSFGKICFKPEQILQIEFDEFKNALPQGLSDEDKDNIIAIIPPNDEYAVSLWGEDGDAENVVCVFSISPQTGYVYANNQCS